MRASGATWGAPRSWGLVLRAVPARRYLDAFSGPHRKISGDHRARFACTRGNTSASGQLLARLTHTFRTGTRTTAPIFNSFDRVVGPCAQARSVPARPSRRNAFLTTEAIDEKNSRIGWARLEWALVRAAHRCPCGSLIRFSASPRPQSSSSANPFAVRPRTAGGPPGSGARPGPRPAARDSRCRAGGTATRRTRGRAPSSARTPGGPAPVPR
jgi:hypothetical protein